MLQIKNKQTAYRDWRGVQPSCPKHRFMVKRNQSELLRVDRDNEVKSAESSVPSEYIAAILIDSATCCRAWMAEKRGGMGITCSVIGVVIGLMWLDQADLR